jgi:ubiquinone biosynthesis protein COQ4
MFKNLEILLYTLQLSENLGNIPVVFKLYDAVSEGIKRTDVEKETELFISQNPGILEMYESKNPIWVEEQYDIEALSTYKENSLAKAYASHMLKSGFKPDFYPHDKNQDIFSFLENRNRKTHDIWHVVTGLGVDVYGEVALQAFYHSQSPSPEIGFVIISQILGAINSGDSTKMDSIFAAISEGYTLGKTYKPLFGIKWEELWNEDLETLRVSLKN